MEYKHESESRRERRLDEIEKKDPGFIPPETPRRKSKTALWTWVGVAILILLLLVWLTFAMFTGDTDVEMITPFPWV